MTKKIIRTVLPIAPNEYDQVYVNQLARALDRLIDEVRESNINIQGLSGEGAANTYRGVLQCQFRKLIILNK